MSITPPPGPSPKTPRTPDGLVAQSPCVCDAALRPITRIRWLDWNDALDFASSRWYYNARESELGWRILSRGEAQRYLMGTQQRVVCLGYADVRQYALRVVVRWVPDE